MSLEFDPGYGAEPFRTLCAEHPDERVYPFKDFRTEWGPIFHRGRLDGSARVLVIGQDPATHETIARRILIGAAGHRVQGFLARLGIDRSYVMINTFLYSVYGQGGGERHKNDPAITAYRNRWLAAVLQTQKIEVAVSLGGLADNAWRLFLATPEGQGARALPYQHIPHPTWPESSSKHDAALLAANTRTMLERWSEALRALKPAIKHPDAERPLQPYGPKFQPGDLIGIPAADLPVGCPAWMGSAHVWAQRTGDDDEQKRRTLTVTVPHGVIPSGV